MEEKNKNLQLQIEKIKLECELKAQEHQLALQHLQEVYQMKINSITTSFHRLTYEVQLTNTKTHLVNLLEIIHKKLDPVIENMKHVSVELKLKTPGLLEMHISNWDIAVKNLDQRSEAFHRELMDSRYHWKEVHDNLTTYTLKLRTTLIHLPSVEHWSIITKQNPAELMEYMNKLKNIRQDGVKVLDNHSLLNFDEFRVLV